MKLHEVAFSIGEKLDNHSAPRSGPNQQPLASQQRQVYIRTGPSPLPTLDQTCLEATRLAFRHRNKVTFSEVLAVPVVTRNPVRSPANKATDATSSDTVGSSSTQTGRPVTNNRASPSRRFCPADRFAARRARFMEHFDATETSLARLRGPIGLYIGSKTPSEIAVSIMAEVLATKNGVVLAPEMDIEAAKALRELNP